MIVGSCVLIIIIVCLVLFICICIRRNKENNNRHSDQSGRPEEPVYVLNVIGESNQAYGKTNEAKAECPSYSEMADLQKLGPTTYANVYYDFVKKSNVEK